MKTWIAALMVTLTGSALAPTASAQDADSLRSAVLDFYAALNNGDERALSFSLPESSQFPRTGSLLEPLPSEITPGFDFAVEVRHLEAKVFGETGVATYYTTGTVSLPDETILRGIYRGSIVAVWQGNQWKWAHLHISKLVSEP